MMRIGLPCAQAGAVKLAAKALKQKSRRCMESPFYM
jgi:hypothetical protein